MTQFKHERMKNEYNLQCAGLYEKECLFRKIARQQIQARALRRKDIQSCNGDMTAVIRKGVNALQITPTLDGLLRKINNTRRMLNMKEISKPKELLC